jgi:hypothetical protein
VDVLLAVDRLPLLGALNPAMHEARVVVVEPVRTSNHCIARGGFGSRFRFFQNLALPDPDPDRPIKMFIVVDPRWFQCGSGSSF